MRTTILLLMGIGLAACSSRESWTGDDTSAGELPHGTRAIASGSTDTTRMKSEEEPTEGPRPEDGVNATGATNMQGANDDYGNANARRNARVRPKGSERSSTEARPSPTDGLRGAGGSGDQSTRDTGSAPPSRPDTSASANAAPPRPPSDKPNDDSNEIPSAAGTNSPHTGTPGTLRGTARPSPLPPYIVVDAGPLR